MTNASWWDIPYPDTFDTSRLASPLARLSVVGNQFVRDAKPLVLRGVNISDPDKLACEGQYERRLFQEIESWGANVIRVPVHPAAFRARGKQRYFELLDQAVEWATELGMYLIIDWHSIGNLHAGMFQHPMYETSLQETRNFWRSVAHRYQGVTTVALYELFNEPTRHGGTLGAISWDQWKKINEELISIIRAHDPDSIALVAGFNWAYDLTPVKEQPIEREGVAYVTHPYPQKARRPYDDKWDTSFGFVAEKYPLIATEIGYMRADAEGAHEPVKDDGSYGPLVTEYLAKKGASWTAWCFDPQWAPPLISDFAYTPTEAGQHFRKVMLESKAREQTSGN